MTRSGSVGERPQAPQLKVEGAAPARPTVQAVQVAQAEGARLQSGGAPFADGFARVAPRSAPVTSGPVPPPPARGRVPDSVADAAEASLIEGGRLAARAVDPSNGRAAADAKRAGELFEDVAKRMDALRRRPDGMLGDDHIAHILFARARLERLHLAVNTREVGPMEVELAPGAVRLQSPVLAGAREAVEALTAASRALETPQAKAELGARHAAIYQAVRQEAMAGGARALSDQAVFATAVATSAMTAFIPGLQVSPSQQAARAAIGIGDPRIFVELDRSQRAQGDPPLTPRGWIAAWARWGEQARGPQAPGMVVNVLASTRSAVETALGAQLDQPFAR